jgi:ABC-type Fe3+-citrate transport system substrate-binding protein
MVGAYDCSNARTEYSGWVMMRVVSLVPSITEALCMLGLQDSIVGVTDYCTAPVEAVRGKERVGGTKNPQLARVLELRPDLVIVNTDENRKATAQELEQLGLRILVTQTDNLDEVEATWTQLGEATGKQTLARHERERIRLARERNRERIKDTPRVSALIMVWKSPWIASGAGTYVESLLESSGIDNVMAGVKTKWIRVGLTTEPAASAGDLKKITHALPQVPEVVLLPNEPFAFNETHRDDFVHLLPREQVHVVDGELLTWWLSRTVEGLDYFYEFYERINKARVAILRKSSV